MPLAASLRRIGIVAWTESTRTKGSFDRRTTLVLVAIGLAGALLVPPLVDEGLQFDRGLYRAAVTSDSPLLPAVLGAPQFHVVEAQDCAAPSTRASRTSASPPRRSTPATTAKARPPSRS